MEENVNMQEGDSLTIKKAEPLLTLLFLISKEEKWPMNGLLGDLASPLCYLPGITALIGCIVTVVFTEFALLVAHERGMTSMVYVPALRYL